MVSIVELSPLVSYRSHGGYVIEIVLVVPNEGARLVIVSAPKSDTKGNLLF